MWNKSEQKDYRDNLWFCLIYWPHSSGPLFEGSMSTEFWIVCTFLTLFLSGILGWWWWPWPMKFGCLILIIFGTCGSCFLLGFSIIWQSCPLKMLRVRSSIWSLRIHYTIAFNWPKPAWIYPLCYLMLDLLMDSYVISHVLMWLFFLQTILFICAVCCSINASFSFTFAWKIAELKLLKTKTSKITRTRINKLL